MNVRRKKKHTHNTEIEEKKEQKKKTHNKKKISFILKCDGVYKIIDKTQRFTNQMIRLRKKKIRFQSNRVSGAEKSRDKTTK